MNLVKLPYKKLNQQQTAVSCFTTGGRDNSGLRAESIRVKDRPGNKPQNWLVENLETPLFK